MTPTLRLAHVPGAQGDNNLIGRKDMKQLLKDHEAPALLVSYVYIEAFLKIQEKYIYRDWMMDSGAYSAYNSGKEIDLHEYINACHLLKDSDPTLTEVIALDVIGSGEGSLRNAVKMKEAGVGYAMPVFHIGDDWEILKEYCKGWDKVGISCRFGESRKDSYKFYDQCFARTWPKKFHSFGWADEEVLMRYPLHCMTDEHTVLTQNGWKGRTEVKQGDYVLAFKDGTSMWEEVNCVYDYSVVDYPIIHMDNRVFSAQVTDHHRWRVHNTFKEAWEWTTTDRLNCHDRIAS